MQSDQLRWTEKAGWQPRLPGAFGASAHLVLIFGSLDIIKQPHLITQIRNAYPHAICFGCSAAGEICGTQVRDDSLVATAIQFESTKVRGASIRLNTIRSSYVAGYHLGKMMDFVDLSHVFVLSNGIRINSSKLVNGLTNALPSHVTITGGLAGDDGRFEETRVIFNDDADKNTIAVLGLYGNNQAAAILERGCNGFIQKPFSLSMISDKIREVLAQ
jgi:hypothetical protein